MKTYIFSALCLGFAFASSSLVADTQDEPRLKVNLLRQACDNASLQSIRITNVNGRCTGSWTCDTSRFAINCEGSECSCTQGEESFSNKITYSGCSSVTLASCFEKSN